MSRAVRVFRGKSSEKFSRAVPKFALASVTSITPCPSTPPPPSPLLPHRPSCGSFESTCALSPENRRRRRNHWPRPPNPHSARAIPTSRGHVTHPPTTRSVSRVPSAPSSTAARFRPPPPPRKTTLGFSPVWPPRPSRRRVLARRPARHSVAKSARAFPPTHRDFQKHLVP